MVMRLPLAPRRRHEPVFALALLALLLGGCAPGAEQEIALLVVFVYAVPVLFAQLITVVVAASRLPRRPAVSLGFATVLGFAGVLGGYLCLSILNDAPLVARMRLVKNGPFVFDAAISTLLVWGMLGVLAMRARTPEVTFDGPDALPFEKPSAVVWLVLAALPPLALAIGAALVTKG